LFVQSVIKGVIAQRTAVEAAVLHYNQLASEHDKRARTCATCLVHVELAENQPARFGTGALVCHLGCRTVYQCNRSWCVGRKPTYVGYSVATCCSCARTDVLLCDKFGCPAAKAAASSVCAKCKKTLCTKCVGLAKCDFCNVMTCKACRLADVCARCAVATCACCNAHVCRPKK
jgi:hypothetical protein